VAFSVCIAGKDGLCEIFKYDMLIDMEGNENKLQLVAFRYDILSGKLAVIDTPGQ